MGLRIDLQGMDEHNSVCYHIYECDVSLADLSRLHRASPHLALLWNIPVKMTASDCGEDARPYSESKTEMAIYYPDGRVEQLS